ncbi:hypothetical protein FPQ18DRAFT_48695 [Pyronema domesticum]|uniref:Uncharacterized protein n=1 Tax=Pyronema omphalodes (strain CBS 100304) TaxID=1076935 RepID=U4L3V2_PYROM|nr:hypothetical protein FPQ18DRAFT_48695 [Pyronema domesticum]CCX10846.1 Similar to conserved hypothetical protein [Aspergillus flavus NRRL3357]; acc. no. XP_002381302 [Pyronema omphalodes CBS 100304]
MAKSRIQKPKTRAEKRAVTPPMEIKGVERVEESNSRQAVAVLGLRGDNGIQKKKSVRGKQLTRAQKARKEKMLDRAEVVTDKLFTKKEESKKKSKVIQGRRGNWEVLNEKMEDDLETALALATVETPIENVKV